MLHADANGDGNINYKCEMGGGYMEGLGDSGNVVTH